MDQAQQLRISQAVQRFFRKLQAQTGISQQDSVMLMLAATWGQARLAGLTTPQLIEWSLKNWNNCDAAAKQQLAALVVEGGGADVTIAETDAAAKRIRST